ncbi:hypothetical protein A1OE_1253 [Candidatus Endolissoclinum faulkneri L2]|uniref:Uncharacterized protein n=1 Tax=Candidatus Endolissoclinum faulkneri L2 TaxID=1193729 RepID=K7YPJ3_9PROT|nr:hypothetical protein A1OE_1253 [Candidatus Endolissoclinum faulkneri L2]
MFAFIKFSYLNNKHIRCLNNVYTNLPGYVAHSLYCSIS